MTIPTSGLLTARASLDSSTVFYRTPPFPVEPAARG
jgi:hypothetical protein